MPPKSVRLFDTEKRTIGKTDDVKSSAARQAWKRAIDLVDEVVSVIAAAFSKVLCEFDTKTAIGFVSGWIFHLVTGPR
jgi:hypothetical protein